LRIALDQLLPLVPALLHPHLCNSRYYAEKTNSLVIQADDSRKQSDNAHSCFARLHSLILEAGSKAIPGETSAAQREHVRDLQKAENERRLRGKKFASNKKAGRRSGKSDE
jgi:peptidyl-tRNA hydrolase ICT1